MFYNRGGYWGRGRQDNFRNANRLRFIQDQIPSRRLQKAGTQISNSTFTFTADAVSEPPVLILIIKNCIIG